MTQLALKQDSIPDEILQIAEQLNSASSLGHRLAAANTDQSALLLAQRFAPDRARRGAPANPSVLPPVEPTFTRRAAELRRLALSVTIGLVSAVALVGGMMWLGGIEDLSLDRAFEDAGLVSYPKTSTDASAALSIDIHPPRSSAPSIGADGDGTVRMAARPEVAPPLAPEFAVRSGETDRIEGLMAHGQKMINVGYLAGARAYYRRAAEAGSGEAALAAGATYDPEIVAKLGVQGIKPDAAEAAKWYARAASLGIADRDTALRALTQDWATEAPQATEVIAAPMAPSRKPHTKQAKTETAKPEPEPQHVAANSAADRIAVKPQLLASEEAERRPGPLSRLVKAAAGLSTQEEWMEVASPVNLRKGPSSNAGTYKIAQKGAKLRVIGRDGNWVKVADPKTNVAGYIYKRFLKESAAP